MASIHRSYNTVSEYMRVERHTMGGICYRVYQEMEGKNLSRANRMVNIGINRTIAILKKGTNG